MVIPPALSIERIMSARPDEAASSASSGRSGCFMLEVSRRRAQTTKFFFTSEAALPEERPAMYKDELLGSVGISDVLRLVASETSDHQRNT